MLDPSLTYTSGVWAPGYDLEDAQNAKYDLIARKLDLKPGDQVLDIGSGFGGFARFASKNYGAKVTGITISVEQLKAARALSRGDENVNFIFSDYRDLPLRFAPHSFDHLVSIEMIEAVGPKNLDAYFSAADQMLKPGGHFVIQGISKPTDAVNTNAWFSTYIFHDGVAPSDHQVDGAAAKYFGAPVDRQRLTENYDRTLMAWHEHFSRAWPSLKNQYGDRFKRMWDFYLLSVAGDFRAKAMDLNQVIYTKGENQGSLLQVRELPSRERLDSMRASAEEKSKTALVIGELEKEKLARAAILTPREVSAPVPLRKDAPIAIIGGGPSGLSAARELKSLGFTHVSVFEKGRAAGGKSHSIEIEGRAHDLGATMGVKLKYAPLEKLARESGQATIPFPQQIYYNLQTGRAENKRSHFDSLKFMYQGLLYLIHHARMTRASDSTLEIPPAELSDPWSVVMGRQGLSYFADQTKTYLTGYGYGGPETPAVFGERMFDANAIIGAALSPPIMWENGSQPLWKNLAATLQVQTEKEISKVERTSDYVRLFFRDGSPSQDFEKVIMAVDPQTSLQLLQPTAEETAVFSQVKYMPYSTFAVRVEGVAENRAEVGYLKENMSLTRVGHPMAWIKRYADDSIFIFHLFAPQSLSDEDIMTNLTQDMSRLGARKLTLVDSRRWPFFPHVDTVAMQEEHFFERARQLQGLNRTVFVNEALGMSTMPDAAEQGRQAALRLASGVY